MCDEYRYVDGNGCVTSAYVLINMMIYVLMVRNERICINKCDDICIDGYVTNTDVLMSIDECDDICIDRYVASVDMFDRCNGMCIGGYVTGADMLMGVVIQKIDIYNHISSLFYLQLFVVCNEQTKSG